MVVGGPEAGTIDILEIRLVPRGAAFLEDYGVRPLAREGELRRTLFAHTPVELRYAVDVAEGSRLDFGLSADAGDEIKDSEVGTLRKRLVKLVLTLGGVAAALVAGAASFRVG